MILALRTIAIVIGLVALRLMFLPSPPAFYARCVRRWGKRTVMIMGTCSLAVAVVLIVVSKR